MPPAEADAASRARAASASADARDGDGSVDALLLAAWLDGRLAAAEALRLDARAVVDPAFAAEVAALRELLAAAPAQVPVGVLARARALARPRPARRWLHRAAAAVLLGSAGLAGYAVAAGRAAGPAPTVESAVAAERAPADAVHPAAGEAPAAADGWFELAAADSPLAAAILSEETWR